MSRDFRPLYSIRVPYEQFCFLVFARVPIRLQSSKFADDTKLKFLITTHLKNFNYCYWVLHTSKYRYLISPDTSFEVGEISIKFKVGVPVVTAMSTYSQRLS